MVNVVRDAMPFKRGKHWAAGSAHYEGSLFAVKDTVHGKGELVILRCVKNLTGAALTAAKDFCQFSTTNALDRGRRIGAFGTGCSASIPSLALDDAYTAGYSIPDNALFYVVEQGLVAVRGETSSVSLSAGDPLACDASGRINGAAAAAGEDIVGHADADAAVASGEIVMRARPYDTQAQTS